MTASNVNHKDCNHMHLLAKLGPYLVIFLFIVWFIVNLLHHCLVGNGDTTTKIFSLNKRNLFRKIASLKVRGHEGFTSANVNNRHSWNLVMRIYLCLKYSNIYLVLASWFREVLFLRRLNQFTCTWLSLFTKHFFQGLVTSMQCST